MTITRARVCLLSVFLTALILQSVAMAYAFLKSRIYSNELSDLILALLQIYSVHLAICIGGIFGGFFVGSSKTTKLTPNNYFWIAFLLVLVWNLFVVWRSVAFGFVGVGTVPEVGDYLKQVSAYSTWLVAGCLTFYFSKK